MMSKVLIDVVDIGMASVSLANIIERSFLSASEQERGIKREEEEMEKEKKHGIPI
jgi:hypothetical protein